MLIWNVWLFIWMSCFQGRMFSEVIDIPDGILTFYRFRLDVIHIDHFEYFI